MKRSKRTLCPALSLLTAFALAACSRSAAPAAPTPAPDSTGPAASAAPTPEPARQTDQADALLFDAAGVTLRLNAYTFIENGSLALTCTAENASEADVILYPSLLAVNGWSVSATANTAGDDTEEYANTPVLTAHASCTLTLTYDLSDPAIAMMGISALHSFAVEVRAALLTGAAYIGQSAKTVTLDETSTDFSRFDTAGELLYESEALSMRLLLADDETDTCYVLLRYAERQGSTLYLYPAVNGFVDSRSEARLSLAYNEATIVALDLSSQLAAQGQTQIASLKLCFWLSSSDLLPAVADVKLMGAAEAAPPADGLAVFLGAGFTVRFDGLLHEADGWWLVLDIQSDADTLTMCSAVDYTVSLDETDYAVEGYALLYPGTRTKLRLPIMDGEEAAVLARTPETVSFSLYFAALESGTDYFSSPSFTGTITVTP